MYNALVQFACYVWSVVCIFQVFLLTFGFAVCPSDSRPTYLVISMYVASLTIIEHFYVYLTRVLTVNSVPMFRQTNISITTNSSTADNYFKVSLADLRLQGGPRRVSRKQKIKRTLIAGVG